MNSYPAQVAAQILNGKVIRGRERLYIALGLTLSSFLFGIVFSAKYLAQDIFLGHFI